MTMIFAFDVDGTLTPARQPIHAQFNKLFCEFAERNLVYLVTGSNREKIEEQLPVETINKCQGMFTCSGAELWTGDELVFRREHTFDAALFAAAQILIENSPYPIRCGQHVEPRPGMINISTVGRNATPMQRADYHRWDQLHGERDTFMKHLSNRFPGYEFSAGGEISIDIVPEGWTKASVKPVLEERHRNCAITFFGDRMDEGGNDKPLADVLADDSKHRAIAVSSSDDTWNWIQTQLLDEAA